MLNAIYEAAKADKENDDNCYCQKIVIVHFLLSFCHLDQDLSSISQFYDTTQIKKHALSRVREQSRTNTLNQNEYILRDEDRRKIVAKNLKEAKLKKL